MAVPWGWASRNKSALSQPNGSSPKDEEHPFWKNKRLTPGRIQVRDIVVKHKKAAAFSELEQSSAGVLDCNDADLANITKDAMQYDDQIDKFQPNAPSMIDWERKGVEKSLKEYGWMQCLRLPEDSKTKCRWIHISSTFPEYLHGVLLSMSKDQVCAVESDRILFDCISQNERFSKHGKYFTPFCKTLGDSSDNLQHPMLVTFPFLDWSVFPGPAPEPRHQIDPNFHYQATRSPAHPLRSMLQYYYRLEDTQDRERSQSFNRYKPWANDPMLLSKVQRWYGQLPTGLAVDEMWILLLDSKHIVSFSNNQSWKPLWPAHQVPYRIAEISFRGLRSNFHLTGRQDTYTAETHMVACISGAVGLLHWSFWADTILSLADRYGGYLSHLQYRLHRSPSTKLVMDLLQVQDELSIVIGIIKKQWDLVHSLEDTCQANKNFQMDFKAKKHTADHVSLETAHQHRQHSTSSLTNPFSQLIANLGREFADLRDLRENCDSLVTRTVQLVNIRLEDHGKAILVFTVVTIIFLPLSFVASFFGMNTNDIRNLALDQRVFWASSLSLTAVVVGAASLAAFYGGSIIERIFELQGEHRHGEGLLSVLRQKRSRSRSRSRSRAK